MKFRKKPVVIEAVQFVDDSETLAKISEFVNHTVRIDYGSTPTEIKILTLEGVMIANLGDWIIKGVNGEFYPCKPDIFEKTYEKVEDQLY